MSAFVKVEEIPVYIQIRNSLHQDIVNRILLPGQKLPSEDELAARFGVSRMTVRQGIADLIDDGLLYRRHGVGTFVAHPHIVRDHSHLSNFVETARKEGIEFKVRLLASEVIPGQAEGGAGAFASGRRPGHPGADPARGGWAARYAARFLCALPAVPPSCCRKI